MLVGRQPKNKASCTLQLEKADLKCSSLFTRCLYTQVHKQASHILEQAKNNWKICFLSPYFAPVRANMRKYVHKYFEFLSIFFLKECTVCTNAHTCEYALPADWTVYPAQNAKGGGVIVPSITCVSINSSCWATKRVLPSLWLSAVGLSDIYIQIGRTRYMTKAPKRNFITRVNTNVWNYTQKILMLKTSVPCARGLTVSPVPLFQAVSRNTSAIFALLFTHRSNATMIRVHDTQYIQRQFIVRHGSGNSKAMDNSNK